MVSPAGKPECVLGMRKTVAIQHGAKIFRAHVVVAAGRLHLFIAEGGDLGQNAFVIVLHLVANREEFEADLFRPVGRRLRQRFAQAAANHGRAAEQRQISSQKSRRFTGFIFFSFKLSCRGHVGEAFANFFLGVAQPDILVIHVNADRDIACRAAEPSRGLNGRVARAEGFVAAVVARPVFDDQMGDRCVVFLNVGHRLPDSPP